MKKELYFIALLPPEPLRSEIVLIKKIFKNEYQSGAALRSPPHITLHMPFKSDREEIAGISNVLKSKLEMVSPFLIKLNDFGSFSPRVIFITVEESPYLSKLYEIVAKVMKGFNITNQDYKDKGFHPHVTVAFRDLRKKEFSKAWEIYQHKNFATEFTCNSLCILKHNGKFWEIDSEIEMIKNL